MKLSLQRNDQWRIFWSLINKELSPITCEAETSDVVNSKTPGAIDIQTISSATKQHHIAPPVSEILFTIQTIITHNTHPPS
jgi:hypothetical protein